MCFGKNSGEDFLFVAARQVTNRKFAKLDGFYDICNAKRKKGVYVHVLVRVCVGVYVSKVFGLELSKKFIIRCLTIFFVARKDPSPNSRNCDTLWRK